MTAERENVVSSFTIVKGSMIEESYVVLAAWDLTRTKKQNLDYLRATNFISAKSKSWLRDVAKVLNRRFDPAKRDRALVQLAKAGCDLEEWKPLVLWHITRDEFLFKDFLTHWLFPTCYEGSAYCVRHEDVHPYLLKLRRREGATEVLWTRTTLHRVSSGLLRMAADFGLLKGSSVREFASYHLPERSFMYLLHALVEKYGRSRKTIDAKEWRMFLLRPADVEKELLRLHESGKLEYRVTSGSTHLALPCQTAEQYAAKMIEVNPGDRCEVNYAQGKIDWLELKTGQIRQAHIFIGVLSFSGLVFAWASEDDKGSHWLQAHRKMFEAFGGVPRTTLCGCIKEGVIKPHRYDPELDPGYAEIAAHYGTTIVPARSECESDQALVRESERRIIRTLRFIYRRHTFTSVAEINYALSSVVDRINREHHPKQGTSRLECWAAEEQHALRAIPSIAFEAVEWKLTRVHPDSTVSLESAYYTVPYQHRGKRVRMKLSAAYVEIFLDHDRIAIHRRDFSRRATHNVIPEHLPENSEAYHEAVPQDLLLEAGAIMSLLREVIDELFTKDTLGNLRRAQRFVRHIRDEIRKHSRAEAEPRIREALEQMRRFDNFRVHYFEATLKQLRQGTKKSIQPRVLIHSSNEASRINSRPALLESTSLR